MHTFGKERVGFCDLTREIGCVVVLRSHMFCIVWVGVVVALKRGM